MEQQITEQATEDAAFQAEMLGDAIAPQESVAEVKVEEPEKEVIPERIEVIAGYTAEELSAALGKLTSIESELASTKKALDTTNGTYGARLQEFGKSLETLRGVSTEIKPEQFKVLKEQFGDDLANAIAQDLSTLKLSIPSGQQFEQVDERVKLIVAEERKALEEARTNDRNERVKYERELETRLLQRQHPDANDFFDSTDPAKKGKQFNGFAKWAQKTLKPTELQELNDTWNADIIGNRITAYKNHLAEEKKKQERLQGAVQTRGVPQKKTFAANEDDEEKAFRAEMAKI